MRLPRRPGQKEERYAQLLGGDVVDEAPAYEPAPPADDRIGRIERELADLRAQVDELRAMLRGSAP